MKKLAISLFAASSALLISACGDNGNNSAGYDETADSNAQTGQMNDGTAAATDDIAASPADPASADQNGDSVRIGPNGARIDVGSGDMA